MLDYFQEPHRVLMWFTAPSSVAPPILLVCTGYSATSTLTILQTYPDAVTCFFTRRVVFSIATLVSPVSASGPHEQRVTAAANHCIQWSCAMLLTSLLRK